VRVGFVACSKTKAAHPMPAGALYASPLFRKSLLAALDASDRIYILSAKHGVLRPGSVIEPYDVALKGMPKANRQEWGRRAGAELDSILNRRDTVALFCGEEYIEPLRRDLNRIGVTIINPLALLSLGQRLQRLAELNEESNLKQQAARFSRLLHRLWLAQSGGRRIRETSGRQAWPARGLYFILEPDHSLGAGRMPRIVRVGTHAVSAGSKTSLWDRLSTHRGTTVGGGSHRSSIFRLHVGRAIMANDPAHPWPKTWSQGQSAPKLTTATEVILENRVSEIIGELSVIWLDVDDDAGPLSERAYLERNAIGLLSRMGVLTPATRSSWIGQLSPDWRIATSGLWNLNHLFQKPDDDFLDRLERAIDRTTGRKSSKPTDLQLIPELKSQFNLFRGTRDT
jgi:hypothetical protein